MNQECPELFAEFTHYRNTSSSWSQWWSGVVPVVANVADLVLDVADIIDQPRKENEDEVKDENEEGQKERKKERKKEEGEED
ncbi:hypothetical protein M0802_004047 [Mischocyttarus mexicanus]|nr:hypothetical protein M0802_004047 [Mischocyttarus mexicanus]